MQRKKKNGISWLEFDLLQLFPEVKHGVFLNLPLRDLDDATNPFRAMNLLGIEKGVKLRQCHKDDLIEVKDTTPNLTHFEEYDGMVSQEKGVALLVRHADCQGTLFYDPITSSLAAVHCGWRGSVCNIYKKTIDTMEKLYGTNPRDLIVWIGPSLGPNHAEFKHYKKELPESFWPFQPRPTYFDFWEISRMQLTQRGVLEKQIEIAEICTYANDKECFSYRRDRSTPHHGTLAAISLALPK